MGHKVSLSTSEDWRKFSPTVCDKSIANKSCLLPSALVNILMDQEENLLSDFKFCDKLLELLGLCKFFKEDVNGHFFLEFRLNFTSEILKFISSTFRANLPRRAQPDTTIAEPDMKDRYVIYYIARSIMRGYLKIARNVQAVHHMEANSWSTSIPKF